jgi:hypothetical protein
VPSSSTSLVVGVPVPLSSVKVSVPLAGPAAAAVNATPTAQLASGARLAPSHPWLTTSNPSPVIVTSVTFSGVVPSPTFLTVTDWLSLAGPPTTAVNVTDNGSIVADGPVSAAALATTATQAPIVTAMIARHERGCAERLPLMPITRSA